MLNTVRRRMFPRFVAPLCVREHVSERHLRELLADQVDIEVTADSAFQEQVPPHRAAQVAGRSTERRLLVAVSAIDFEYPGTSDPDRRRARYDDAMRTALEHLHASYGAQLLFLPQRYGRVHSDVPYLERLGASLGHDVVWEIVDPTIDSDGQRALIGGADFCIASRYHPQVFSISAGVASVCIYYEHKALGLMQQVGLEGLALDIATIRPDELLAAIEDALARRDELRAIYRREEPALRARAARSTEITVAALRSAGVVSSA
jgi:colanic acid/amylovoran biosynthesis protein